jgi:cold shock CspA family protein
MATGTIKWFNNSKSYGMIISDDGVEIPTYNYYNDSLLEGYRVEYNVSVEAEFTKARIISVIDRSYYNNPIEIDESKEIVLNDYPRISIYDDVLSAEYCADLINRTTASNYDAKYITMDAHQDDCSRDTSGQANDKNIKRRILNDFNPADYDILATALVKTLGRPYALIESIDILYYQKGHYMTPHHDYPYNPRRLDYYRKAGTRDAVALIYLNDNFEGGETYFPKLELSITPKTGRLSIWNHTDDNFLNWNLVHESKEILEGEKFAVIFCLSNVTKLEGRGY